LIDQTYEDFCKQAPDLSKHEIKQATTLPVSELHLKISVASRGNINIC